MYFSMLGTNLEFVLVRVKGKHQSVGSLHLNVSQRLLKSMTLLTFAPRMYDH